MNTDLQTSSIYKNHILKSAKNYKIALFSPIELYAYKIAAFFKSKNFFYKTYKLLIKQRKDIAKYKDIHFGKRCFIIGGGPSLLQTDLIPLKNEITFGVNNIFLIFDSLNFQPNYYVVEDWFVYEDRFEDIKQYVTKSECFFPIQFSRSNFDRINHHYFRAAYEFEEYSDWPNFSDDASKIIWIGGTVSYVCMQLAFYMGFSKIYLIGFDHFYQEPEDVEKNGTRWRSNSDDPNHFDKNYFGKGYRWHDPNLTRMEKAYRKANRIFNESDRKILNATKGGKLDIFERVDYEALF